MTNGKDWPTVQDKLDRILQCETDLNEAKYEFKRAVLAAHEAGASWGDIASILGVSRQAAWQRFGLPTTGEH